MIVTIRGESYECRTATKEGNKVTLYLGRNDEHGNEMTSVFYDFPDEDIVGVEDVSEPTREDRLEAQITYTAMMTDTLLEV